MKLYEHSPTLIRQRIAGELASRAGIEVIDTRLELRPGHAHVEIEIDTPICHGTVFCCASGDEADAMTPDEFVAKAVRVLAGRYHVKLVEFETLRDRPKRKN